MRFLFIGLRATEDFRRDVARFWPRARPEYARFRAESEATDISVAISATRDSGTSRIRAQASETTSGRTRARTSCATCQSKELASASRTSAPGWRVAKGHFYLLGADRGQGSVPDAQRASWLKATRSVDEMLNAPAMSSAPNPMQLSPVGSLTFMNRAFGGPK